MKSQYSVNNLEFFWLLIFWRTILDNEKRLQNHHLCYFNKLCQFVKTQVVQRRSKIWKLDMQNETDNKRDAGEPGQLKTFPYFPRIIIISCFAGLAWCFWWIQSRVNQVCHTVASWFDATPAVLTATRSHLINNNDGIKPVSHLLKWNGFCPSSVILLSVPLAFCNLLPCLCSLSHFNITASLQLELQDKFCFILWD